MLSHRRRMPKESNGSTSPEDMRISEGRRKFLGNFEIGGPAGVAMGAKKGVELELEGGNEMQEKGEEEGLVGM